MGEPRKLILRAVDPKKVVDAIFCDPNYSIPISKVNLKISEVIRDIPVGVDTESDVYEHLDNQGRRIRTFCIDHVRYSGLKQSGNDGQSLENITSMCDWCRQKSEISWVIPLHINHNKGSDKVYFVGEGAYCSKECMYADYSEHYKFKFTGSKYQEIHTHISYLCHLRNEKFPLPAPHWKLHHNNGGMLPDKDFYNNKNIYTENPNVVMLPIKRQFFITK